MIYLWILFMILCFLTLGFAMGWNARGVKEIDDRFKKADDSINEQIKRYEEEGMKKCSQIYSKQDSPPYEIPCATDVVTMIETESI